MKMKFVRDYPIEQTMKFDLQYEPELQMDIEEKTEILSKSIVAFLIITDEEAGVFDYLAGEAYGLCPTDFDEQIEDLEGEDLDSIYLYSLTIDPEVQGMGLGTALLTYWLGIVSTTQYKSVTSHSTAELMDWVFKAHSFEFTGIEHEKWYGTERTAKLVRLKL